MNCNFSKKIIGLFLLFFLIFLLFSVVVFATNNQDDNQANNQAERPGFGRIKQVIDNVHDITLVIVGLAAVGAMIYAGLRWAFSAGDASAITEAKKSIFSVFIGLLIVMFSVFLLDFLEIKIEVPEPPAPIVIPDPVDDPAEEPDEEPEEEEIDDGIILTIDIVSLKTGEKTEIKKQIIGGDVNIRNLNRVVYGRELVRMHIKEIKFKNPDTHNYGVIVFEKPEFRGRCGIITKDKNIGWSPGSIRSFTMPKTPLDGGDMIFYNYPHDPLFKQPNPPHNILQEIQKHVPLPIDGRVSLVIEKDNEKFYPFSVEVFPRQEHLIILRNPVGECYVIQRSVKNIKNLWWATTFRDEFVPRSVSAVQILRLF